jgi:predicted 3-demethylubiquinone-9 3-methyltransferase (glyoxalase superfamily)
MTKKHEMSIHEAIIELCKSLSKRNEEDREAASGWMEDKFGVSLWSVADMKPETLKEILDIFDEEEKSKK